MIAGRLVYDAGTDRYQIADEAGEIQHPGLHCGECFAVLLPEGWTDTRIELDGDGWYLVGTPLRGRLDNLFVRHGR